MKDKFLMFASKVGAQRHLNVLRDSFAMLMPLIMAGSFATMLSSLIRLIGTLAKIEDIGSIPFFNFIISINGNVWWGTFDMITIFVVVLIGYNLGKSYDANPAITAVIAISTYLCIVPQVPPGEGAGWGSINRNYTNAMGLFVGIFVAMLAIEIFAKLFKNKALIIKMPEAVPPAIARSFAALLPGAIAIIGTSAIVYTIEKLFGLILKPEVPMSIFDLVTKFVSAPITNVSGTLGAALGVTFMQHFLWIFGLHGSNILEGIMQPVYMPALTQNIEAFANGQPVVNIVTKQMFDTYINMGGSGTTLGLLIAIFISSKSAAKRSIATLSFPPGIFNINEPVLFGMPIVLNPILAIPFIVTPLVLTTLTYLMLQFNIAGRTIAIAPWFTPPIISAIITTDKPIQSAILQIVNMAISVLIYLPFVALSDKAEIQEEEKAKKAKQVAGKNAKTA